MNIKIITVGKIKEKYLRMAIDEYSKRLGAYCRLEIIEVKDEKIEERFSDAEKARAVALEGERIARYLKDNEIIAALKITGRQLTSPDFAKKIEHYGLQGKSSLTFVIGGSLGLAKSVTDRADYRLSFSNMTFPHGLMRVILLEQLYRAERINAGERYHK